LIDNELQTHPENILPTIRTLAITKRDYNPTRQSPSKIPDAVKISFAKEQNLT
jgi:hypothetical protein